MQTKNVIEMYRILSGLKLNKFSDKELRKGLIVTYLNFSEVVKKFDSKIDELRKKYLEDVQGDLDIVIELERKLQNAKEQSEINSINEERVKYKRVYDLSNEINETVEKFANEEVAVNISKVDKNKFIEEVADDITLSQIDSLAYIFE